ncbi:MAG: hypothetical protein PVI57_14145 [Gemmatimonadota bacterium]|jgi:hypothetical protein
MKGSVIRRAAVGVFLLLAASSLGCGDDEPVGPREPEDVEFAPSLNVDLEQMNEVVDGVFVRTLQEGSGTLVAAPGTLATIRLTVFLPDGTQALGPVETEIPVAGAPEPFVGLGLALPGTFVGEVRQVVVASRLAWGSVGAEGIPTHSVVVMEVEMLDLTLPR